MRTPFLLIIICSVKSEVSIAWLQTGSRLLLFKILKNTFSKIYRFNTFKKFQFKIVFFEIILFKIPTFKINSFQHWILTLFKIPVLKTFFSKYNFPNIQILKCFESFEKLWKLSFWHFEYELLKSTENWFSKMVLKRKVLQLLFLKLSGLLS